MGIHSEISYILVTPGGKQFLQKTFFIFLFEELLKNVLQRSERKMALVGKGFPLNV